MSSHRRSIGALARESGLTVSALRFYDAAGVLRPARVDPATGYRWYDTDQVHSARLIAGLRAASMPLPDISAASRPAWPTPGRNWPRSANYSPPPQRRTR